MTQCKTMLQLVCIWMQLNCVVEPCMCTFIAMVPMCVAWSSEGEDLNQNIHLYFRAEKQQEPRSRMQVAWWLWCSPLVFIRSHKCSRTNLWGPSRSLRKQSTRCSQTTSGTSSCTLESYYVCQTAPPLLTTTTTVPLLYHYRTTTGDLDFPTRIL